ncbi:MAG: triose-phosphate isomerase [bacterium]
MRRPIMAANWKMNKIRPEAVELAEGLVKQLKDVSEVEIVLCPPFTALGEVADVIEGSRLALGAQNMYYQPAGAYTGEVSGAMLVDLGCQYVIIGHSERREYFHEDNELINLKVKAALGCGLSPILCVGERLFERQAGKAEEVVYEHLTAGLKGITRQEMLKVVIAYEPVWAIGTGQTATPKDAETMHLFIRKTLTQMYDQKLAQAVRIQYGGSVKPENIEALMAEPDIDGALVGGASLEIDSFSRIVRFNVLA